MNTKRIGMLAGGTAVIALAAIGAFMLFSDGKASAFPPGAPPVPFTPAEFHTQYLYEREGKSLDDLSEDRRAKELRHQEWREHGIFRKLAGDVDALAEAWSATVLDPSGVLDEKLQSDLLHLIARHAMVRAQNTPAQYIELIESSETSHWNDAVGDHYKTYAFYTFFAARTMPTAMDGMEMLHDVWRELKKYDHLFEAVGVGEKSSVFVAKRVHEDVNMDSRNLAGDGAYWTTNANGAGVRFSEANRTIEGVLAEHPSVLAVYGHVLVRLRDGRIAIWKTTWFFDPALKAWTLDGSVMASSKTAEHIW